MLGDLSSGQHVRHRHLEGGDRAAARGGNVALPERRPVAGLGHRVQFGLGRMQQFEAVHHHSIVSPQESQLARVFRALADLRGGDVLEIIFQEGKDIPALCIRGGPHGELLASSTRGQ